MNNTFRRDAFYNSENCIKIRPVGLKISPNEQIYRRLAETLLLYRDFKPNLDLQYAGRICSNETILFGLYLILYDIAIRIQQKH